MPLLVLALLVAACAPQVEPADTVPAPGNGDRVTGTVRIVGSAPVNVQVVVEPDQGQAVRVAGPMTAEIQQLAGARVELRGRMESAPDPMVSRQLRVESYEIISVNGEPVTTGTVVGHQGNWTLLRLGSGEVVYLAGPPERLRAGQKVWIQGPSARIVQSYGVLTQ
jgi:hypothetical protein